MEELHDVVGGAPSAQALEQQVAAAAGARKRRPEVLLHLLDRPWPHRCPSQALASENILGKSVGLSRQRSRVQVPSISHFSDQQRESTTKLASPTPCFRPWHGGYSSGGKSVGLSCQRPRVQVPSFSCFSQGERSSSVLQPQSAGCTPGSWGLAGFGG